MEGSGEDDGREEAGWSVSMGGWGGGLIKVMLVLKAPLTATVISKRQKKERSGED